MARPHLSSGRNIWIVTDAGRSSGVTGPPLTGRRVQLRAVNPGDYEYLFALTSHEDIAWRFRWRGVMPNPETFAQTLWHNALVNFVIERRESKQKIGFIQAFDASDRHGWCHIAMTLDPSLALMGWAMESTVLFLNYIFTLWPFRKVYATMMDFNMNEFTSVTKFGFELEGRLHEHEYHDGRYWDMLLYSFSRESWNKFGVPLLPRFIGEENDA